MLRDLNVSSGGRRDCSDGYVGPLAGEIPTGFTLPPLLLNDIDGAYPTRRYSVEILTLPSAGVMYVEKTSAFSFTGAPDGVYTGTQRVRKFDPDVGLVSTEDTTYSLTIGSVVTNFPAVVLSNGKLVSIPAEQLGTGKKAVVYIAGRLRQRQTSEGTPVVITSGRVRLLHDGETINI